MKKKNGFTLVEMLIVLGIISILGLISEGALLANRNYQRLAGPAEEIVSLIRDAQSRAIAIVKDGDNTKAWEFKLDGSAGIYYVRALNSDSDTLAESTSTLPDGDRGNLPEGTAVNVNISGNNSTAFYSTFSTPFARAYLGSTNPTNFSGNCVWKDGGELRTRPAKDLYIDSDCTSVISPARPGTATITLVYKGNTITITVNTNGDITYQ